MSEIKKILNSFNKDKLNILSFISSLKFIESISETGHNFFLINNKNNLEQHDINTLRNIYIINQVGVSYDWDLILISSRLSNEIEIARNNLNHLGLNAIIYEENNIRKYFPQIPPNQEIPRRFMKSINQTQEYIHVFENEKIRDSWPEFKSSYIISKNNNTKLWNDIFYQARGVSK